MNPDPENRRPVPARPQLAEFEQWLKAHPENFAKWMRVIEQAAAGEFGELTPELRASVADALSKRQVARGMEIVRVKFKELVEVLVGTDGQALPAEERLARASQLMDQITDALLETPEPYRSRFLTELLPLRGQIRALRADGE
jgi:hypothetical protein